MRGHRAVWFIVALGLGLWSPALAVPLRSDDFKNGLAPFWKVHQILRDTDAGTYGPAKAEASGGMLQMTSESDDIWFKTFQPFLVYQENITGAFDIRIQAISHNGQDSWSGAGGLMILQSVPEIVVEEDPGTYPSHWMIDASNGHGPEDKGGGQAQSRENELLDLGTGTPLQPPYWLRMLRIGNSLWRFHSTDGGKSWIADGPRVDLAHIRSSLADDVKPIKDPVAVGIVQQAHDGAGNPVTAVLGPFQALPAVPTGTLTGMLCDVNALPLPHASFRAIATSGSVIPVGTDIPISTDENGEVTEELAAGTYTLRTDATGRPIAGFPMQIIVTAGEATEIGILIAGDLPPFFEAGAGTRLEDDFLGGTLNAMWTNADVGTAGGSSGSAAVANGVLSITAGGRGVRAGRPDVGYNGTFLKVSGDFAATVQVLAVPDNQENAFAGLVETPSTDPFAAFALQLITPRHPIQQWVRPIRGANPIATQVPDTQGSTILPAWLKLRRVGDTVAYWWTKDPTQGTPVFGGMDQLDDFAAKELLVGVAASAAVSDTSADAGFKFAHFRLVPLGN
jgi:hypothetical protein